MQLNPIDNRENKTTGPAMVLSELGQEDWQGLWFIRESGYEAWFMVVGVSGFGEVCIKCGDPDDYGSMWITPKLLETSYERSRDCINWQFCIKWKEACPANPSA